MYELNVTQILLAEDNPADVMLVEESLKEHAIECNLTVMRDGAEAIRYFQDLDANSATRVPDLVLLDLHLPKHDGHEILREIRTSRRCAGTPVVVMTSSESPSDLAGAQRHSARFFRKPPSLDAFLTLGTLVKQVLTERVA